MCTSLLRWRLNLALEISQGSASTYFRWSGQCRHNFVKGLFQDNPSNFYGNRFIFDREGAKNKLAQFFETRCTMYYRSGPGVHCCIAPGRRCACIHLQVATFFCVIWRHGRHLESVTSNRKLDTVDLCVFGWRTFQENFQPNFIQFRFETTEPWAFLKTVAPTRRTRRWGGGWVAK